MTAMLRQLLQVLKKEVVDALRDRRTIAVMLLSSVAIGPVMLLGLSALVAELETQARARTLMAVGIDHAPTLANYAARQGYTLEPAPADHERALARRDLGLAVLVLPPDFEAALLAGRAPQLVLKTASGNTRAQSSASQWQQLLAGFQQEQAMLRLVWRGVPPAVLQVIQTDEQDMADARQRSAQFTRMLPMFILMAVVYGAFHTALDSTAGERERGSLEPLLMTPASRAALVLGKWGAVALLAMGVAVLSCLSFLPGQWLLRSEMLAASFQFGPREAALFLALLLPLAALMAAAMMALALRSRSVKEAQASGTVLVLACSFAPMVPLFSLGGEAPWHLWVPALAQSTLMQRVLSGEAIAALDLLQPLAVAAALTLACLAHLVRQLGRVS
ncbi:ABC transporter permease subunit [Ideonella sp. DXS22W]|uniref:ABC transporter permease subunit n=1 Tax=Pseudaquabacterium inlustre TaxID=2984192 RepID=A0ABU9CM12_9BURK